MKWPAWLCRLVPYLGRRQAEEDLREELRLHLELERERQRDAGLSESDALRAARRRLGNGPLIRERTRDVWGWRWLDDLVRDVRQAVRGLGHSPGFAATVMLVLALGIGANTAMFSIVYGMLIRPLPYPDAEAIVRVGESFGPERAPGMRLSNRSMPLLQESAGSFEQLAAYQEVSLDWAGPDAAVSLSGAMVSPSLFALLRATPSLGRLFTEEEARVGRDRVALLSHGAWIRHFGADPDIVGTPVVLAGNPHTVVGVLSEGFYFPNADVEIWTPYVIPPFIPPSAVGPGEQRVMVTLNFSAVGRLRPGVSPEQAATEGRTILQRSSDDFLVQGESPPEDSLEIDVHVVPLLEQMVGAYRPALLALTAAMALVLLIACINVAGLLLARGVARQRALAVGAALGAGRSRLVRQLLTESVVLSTGGGVLGLAAAAVVLRTVPALVPGNVARLNEASIDGVVLAFTAGLSIVVGLLFGAAPAFQWSRVELVRTLNEGGARSAGGFGVLRSNRARAALATAQVALALVLLTGAGLLLRSFVQLVTVDRGYDPSNVIAARARNPDLLLSRQGMTAESMMELMAANQRFHESLVEEMARLQSLPQVEAVGVSTSVPLVAAPGGIMPVHVDGQPPPSDPGALPRASVQAASPGYFDVLRLRIREGRAFTRLDAAGGPRVLVVNETLARRLFGGESAVGQRLVFQGPGGTEPWEVIGVVADILYEGLTLAQSRAVAFVPLAQAGGSPMFGFRPPIITVRTAGDPLAVVDFLGEAVAAAHPSATVFDVMTMDARLSTAVAQPRFYAVFVGCFAGLAVFLASFGLYGLLGYTVAQRRGEIGIRIALGAQRGNILGLLAKQGTGLVAAGAVVGVAASAASSGILESFLYGVTTDDLTTFVVAPLVLVAVAFVACWLPARRATRVEPMEVLRFE
ncbi:MAG: ABC transporter permease [Acidobacteria bacterium]|nr:ABC transporter permease [Acidobacteriota bacterium]